MPDLFEPATFAALHRANQSAMAPLTRGQAHPDGTPTGLMAAYYAHRADAGLDIAEGTQPAQVAQGFRNKPGRARGGLIAVQLMHASRIGRPPLYPSAHQSVAPSSIPAAGACSTPEGFTEYPEPHTLTLEEIDDFVCALRLAIDTGFGAVEIHGGNGFSPHEFLAATTDLKDDIEQTQSPPLRALAPSHSCKYRRPSTPCTRGWCDGHGRVR
ncbi:hypothetical protein [Aeromicrobium sp.]|uniref:oxidoreductase n=1 Tax=Aeromicrobium sp. TaxID=1871063 RepID=UPI0019C0D25B|nr:hypothetical protein [Aeromicrobium sp.]MBC7631523.1 hypothetical protein [Aeromicrobium sp.]